MKRDLASDIPKKEEKEVSLYGWVNKRRDHGKINFLDLRDSSGIIQGVATPKNEKAYKVASKLGSEDVINVLGIVNPRPESNINADIETGKVEVIAGQINLINKAEELPIPVEGDGRDIEEKARFKYRHLDLRRERLQKNLKVRHKFVKLIHEFLDSKEFTEIETPYLSQSTPEGARDFLVPSRLQKGKFYALAQSPQQYKQLLMIAGFERYYQFPRAFRDEDLRADRQFEHTQLDIEMAFVERDDVLDLIEKLMTSLAEKLGKKITNKPFPRYSYQEAMKKYSADKFDERKNKEDKDKLAFAFVIDFPLFEYSEEEKRWTFSHTPFTAPKKDDVANLKAEKD